MLFFKKKKGGGGGKKQGNKFEGSEIQTGWMIITDGTKGQSHDNKNPHKK